VVDNRIQETAGIDGAGPEGLQKGSKIACRLIPKKTDFIHHE